MLAGLPLVVMAYVSLLEVERSWYLKQLADSGRGVSDGSLQLDAGSTLNGQLIALFHHLALNGFLAICRCLQKVPSAHTSTDTCHPLSASDTHDQLIKLEYRYGLWINRPYTVQSANSFPGQESRWGRPLESKFYLHIYIQIDNVVKFCGNGWGIPVENLVKKSFH